ncbi:FecR family protein [Confluentibacter sediminis]|uniref:FecR family protein n=1 Tax=Confluentibacter sediminis TaxID=2219045 RepID=UPI000DAB84A7|nr:FecR family protein [Confluentibacter sediminis]
MKHLIIKLFTDSISEPEKEKLLNWLREEDNLSILKNYIQHDYDLNKALVKPDINRAYESLIKRIETLERPEEVLEKTKPVVSIFRKSWFKYVAAATVVSFLVSGYFFRNRLETVFPKPIIVNNTIKPGNDKATLTLETGETIALEKGNIYETQNATSNGKEIIYHAGEKSNTEIAYNTLTIPRGGKFYIMLSDSTKVWLNSESQLKYPVTFNDGQLRQVELVYGEAYFEVSHSTEHKGSHFKVMHNKQEVEVLGTEFNIRAYKEETNIYTTLVKGKVEVSFENQRKILKPEEQSNLNPTTKVLDITNVDVYDQTSWKVGVFSFKRKTLKEIMQVLSRWYDMEVVIENKSIENRGFNGGLGKDQDIIEILQTLKQFGAVNEYQINNKTVILK